MTPGAVMDAEFTNAVLGVRAGRWQIPTRLSPNATEEQINNAVELCVRARATIGQCGAVGQEVAAIYLSRPRSERQPR